MVTTAARNLADDRAAGKLGHRPVGKLLNDAKQAVARFLRIHERKRFRGTFASYSEAIATVRGNRVASYDDDAIVGISYDEMCKVHPWDYPIIYWLSQVLDEQTRLIDAGGHLGTKYRAFSRYLGLSEQFDWTILEVPAIVRAGRKLAAQEGIASLSFYERAEDLPESNVLLASGLFQYLDACPSELVSRLVRKPRHLLINKVATREGPTVVTLERFFSVAEIPYQVRDRVQFEEDLASAGYAIRDQWEIPSFSRYHKAFGHSVSRGYYAELEK